ncbi:tetratricopeptide repeat protein [Laspinema olomoucense]|uniref:tetratricopeptide repeat protein n=1 Tax=Laspinema olomoucense TaxID=3231600 RepID=UPI0021BB1AEA|nr:tetratricopeptide repeat protein [Laspinema sp. D3d]MCT7975086.1 tetratricopeptide repeat protein [Laspinema sp. D3d]
MTMDKGQMTNDRRLAQQGETARQQGQYDEAIAHFTEAIALNPEYAWATAHRGETYCLMKRYSEALEDFNRAVELTPTAWNYAHRGAVYRKLYRYEEALGDFNQAIAIEPNYAWAIAYRCLIYDLMGRYQEGLREFDRAIALEPSLYPTWRSKRGLILYYQREYAEAIACCDQALQHNPQDHQAFYCKAVAKAHWQGVIAAKEEIEAAQIALQSALDTPERGIVLYRLAGLSILMGQSEQGLSYLQEAIPLESETIELVQHDLVWRELLNTPEFRKLIAQQATGKFINLNPHPDRTP